MYHWYLPTRVIPVVSSPTSYRPVARGKSSSIHAGYCMADDSLFRRHGSNVTEIKCRCPQSGFQLSTFETS